MERVEECLFVFLHVACWDDQEIQMKMKKCIEVVRSAQLRSWMRWRSLVTYNCTTDH